MIDDLFTAFLAETDDNLDRLDRDLLLLEQAPQDRAALDRAFRALHSFKGTCGFLEMARLEGLAHAGENTLDLAREAGTLDSAALHLLLRVVDRIRLILQTLRATQVEPTGDDSDVLEASEDAPAAIATEHTIDTLRITTDAAEGLMTQMAELVLARNRLQHQQAQMTPELQRLHQAVAALQERIITLRLQPAEHLFRPLGRLVRDQAQEMRKRIRLTIAGTEVGIDRQVIDLLREPMLHLVRNAIDHGIEMPEERIAAGKPAEGRLEIQASYAGGDVIITIRDDGRGLDRDAIRRRAVARNLLSETEAAQLSEAAIEALIFAPGFSTASEVTALSGRGVGLDVVRDHVERIGGTVTIVSQAGEYTLVTIKTPLTLTIIPALLAECHGNPFAVPQRVLQAVVQLNGTHRLELVNDAAFLRWRGQLLPVAFLERRLSPLYVLILRGGRHLFGLGIARAMTLQDIVVQPIAKLAKGAPFSGQTLLGDGRVVPVLDANALIRPLLRHLVQQEDAASDDAAPEAPEARENFLLFHTGGAATAKKALRLSDVFRLEQIDPHSVREVRGTLMTPYRGGLLRLAPLSPITAEATTIVVQQHGELLGLVAEKQIDILDGPMPDAEATQCVLRGQPVELLNLDAAVWP